MSTTVNSLCHCCGRPLRETPLCGRVLLGRSDGVGLYVREFCGDCWALLGDRLQPIVELLIGRTKP